MPAKYDEATKAKAVRLVVDHRDDYRQRVGRDESGLREAGDDHRNPAQVGPPGRDRPR